MKLVSRNEFNFADQCTGVFRSSRTLPHFQCGAIQHRTPDASPVAAPAHVAPQTLASGRVAVERIIAESGDMNAIKTQLSELAEHRRLIVGAVSSLPVYASGVHSGNTVPYGCWRDTWPCVSTAESDGSKKNSWRRWNRRLKCDWKVLKRRERLAAFSVSRSHSLALFTNIQRLRLPLRELATFWYPDLRT